MQHLSADFSRQRDALGARASARLRECVHVCLVVYAGEEGDGAEGEGRSGLLLAKTVLHCVARMGAASVHVRGLGAGFAAAVAEVARECMEVNDDVQCSVSEGGEETQAKEALLEHWAALQGTGNDARDGTSQADSQPVMVLVVLGCPDRTTLSQWNEWTRAQPAQWTFLASDVRGALGYAFADFGGEGRFRVHNRSGEDPAVLCIAQIEPAKDPTTGEETATTIVTISDHMHNVHGMDLDSEDWSDDSHIHEGWVRFENVVGVVDPTSGQSINLTGKHRVHNVYRLVARHGGGSGRGSSGGERHQRVLDRHKLEVDLDTRGWSVYEYGGDLVQERQPVPLKSPHRAFAESVINPVLLGDGFLPMVDAASWGRSSQLHIALRALWDFHEAHERWPAADNVDDAEAVVAQARTIVATPSVPDPGGLEAAGVELDEDLVRSLALRQARVPAPPLQAYFGGVIALEVVKATGHFTPLSQWAHLDMSCAAIDGTTALQDARILFVGCGAIATELATLVAHMGAGTGPRGSITLVDDAVVRASDLPRNHVAGKQDCGRPKVHVLRDGILRQSSSDDTGENSSSSATSTVNTFQVRLGPETLAKFDDAFWDSLDLVITGGCDSVRTRKFVDAQCVFFEKPMLDCGMLGSKAHVQPIYPRVTCCYADIPDDPHDETLLPLDGVRNFPRVYAECVLWAQAKCVDIWTTRATMAQRYLNDKDAFLDELTEQQQQRQPQWINTFDNVHAAFQLVKAQEAAAAANDAAAVTATTTKLAWQDFFLLFRDCLDKLLHIFPPDACVQDGDRFWSGDRRMPRPISAFDVNNPLHLEFLTAASHLYGAVFQLRTHSYEHAYRESMDVRTVVETLSVPARAKAAARATGDGDGGVGDDDDQETLERARFAALISEMRMHSPRTGANIVPLTLSGADATPWHAEFVHAAANLRALTYHLSPCSRDVTRRLTSDSVPSLISTAASVAGLAAMQVPRLLQPVPPTLEELRDSTANFGINLTMLCEPGPAKEAKERTDALLMETVRCRPDGYLTWDKLYIREGRRLTLREFLDVFHRQTNLQCDTLYLQAPLSDTGRTLYNTFSTEAAVFEAKMDTDLLDWVRERYGNAVLPPGRTRLPLAVVAVDDNGATWEVPTICYEWA